MKYNDTGDLQWTQYHQAGGDSSVNGRAVAISPWGDAFVVGDHGLGFASDMVVLKYSSFSSQEWNRSAGGSGEFFGFVKEAAFDGDGNTYIVGPAVDSNGDVDIVTTKMNSLGSVEWTAVYDSPEGLSDRPVDLVIDSQGSCYILAWTTHGEETHGHNLIKYDHEGLELWNMALGEQTAWALAIDVSGDIFVGNHGVTRFDSFGTEQWHHHSPSEVLSLEPDNEGGIYATTRNEVGRDSLKRFDPQGSLLWSASSPVDDIAIDDSGNAYTVGGYVYSTYYGVSAKFSPDGRVEWVMLKGGREIMVSSTSVVVGGREMLSSLTPGGGEDWSNRFPSQSWTLFDFVVDQGGNIYATGFSADYGISIDGDLQTIKYDQFGNRLWLVKYSGNPSVGHLLGSSGLDSASNLYIVWDDQWSDFGTVPVVLKYTPGRVVASVDEGQTNIEQFVLHQNFPNPFNPSTMIRFNLPTEQHVDLKVFDILGREVAVVIDQNMVAGRHEAMFDGSSLSSGVYFYRLTAGENIAVRKFILMK